MDQFKSNKFPM